MGPGESVRVTAAYLEDEGETPGPSRVEVLRTDHDTGGRDRPDEEATYSHITSQQRGTEHVDAATQLTVVHCAETAAPVCGSKLRNPRRCGSGVDGDAKPEGETATQEHRPALGSRDDGRTEEHDEAPMNMPARRPKRSVAGPAKNAPAQLPAT